MTNAALVIPAAEPEAAAPIPSERIPLLDVTRGVAVMGILAMNIVAFAMPFQAYMNPVAYGAPGAADIGSWLFSFIFIDGKMRGLFSFLFGASTLLVIERAEAAGRSPAAMHYRRMAWLLLFGLAHFYFIWFGDILSLYALCGLILFLFRNLSVRALMIWAVALVLVQFLFFAGFGYSALQMSANAATLDADQAKQWRDLQESFGPITGERLDRALALHLGPWTGLVHDRLIVRGFEPFNTVLIFGWETLGYMLFGMAALKSGLFRGEWPLRRYRLLVAICLVVAVPVYAALAWLILSHDFGTAWIVAAGLAGTVPFRPLMVWAYAALIVLLARDGGWLVDRIAAAGRAAFTNYLGTSILMTTLFYGYGLGLYGSLSRIELWIPVLATWALMLAWSKPWLDRYRYGPFEWVWRSLARWELQPMRKALPAE